MAGGLNRRSLKLQLVLVIGLLAFASSLLFAALAGHLSREQIETDQSALLQQVATRMSTQLAQDLNVRAHELLFLTSLEQMLDPLSPLSAKQDLLVRVRKAYSFYAWLGLTDADGNIIASTESRINGNNVAQRDWFLGGRQGLYFGDVHNAALLGKLLPQPLKDDLPLRLVDVSAPVLDEQGRFIGVLAVHLSLDWAFEARERMLHQVANEHLEMVVLNAQGKLLMGTSELPSLKLDLSGLQTVAAARHGHPAVALETWPDGRSYLTTAVFDQGLQIYPGMGWTVVVRTPEEKAFATAATLSRLILLGGLFGALLFSVLLWWIVARQLRPLEQLSVAAQQFRTDGPSPPLPEPVGDGEVAVFTRSLISLVNALGESQERSRRLFDDAPVAMAHIGQGGAVLARNARFDTLFGYNTGESPSAADWFERAFPNPTHRLRALNAWNSVVDKATPYRNELVSSEHRVCCRDGSERIVQITAIAVQDGTLTSFHDVTKQRQTESRLRLWAESFEQARLGLVISDARSNTVIAANPAFARERGYEREAMVGMPLSQLFPSDLADELKDLFRTLEVDTHGVFETEHITYSGHRFPVLLDITVLRDENGQPVNRVAYALDLTERRRAEQEVRLLNGVLELRVSERTAALSAANRELDSFAYSVSHDLRAPLRTMNGFAQILVSEHGDELDVSAKNCVNRILAASLKMGELIEGMLTLSHSARVELRRDAVDLSGMATRRLAELAQGHPARHVTVEVQPGLMATGDARMMEMVMSNLIENAWKYTGKTPAPVIRVHRGTVRGVTGFCVTDNGNGFDMAHADRLFQPFQRLHRREEFDGTGVGLATVQRIIERHGGQIVAEAAPGQGASFCFTLPSEDLVVSPGQSEDQVQE